jgi:hypothetical protein
VLHQYRRCRRSVDFNCALVFRSAFVPSNGDQGRDSSSVCAMDYHIYKIIGLKRVKAANARVAYRFVSNTATGRYIIERVGLFATDRFTYISGGISRQGILDSRGRERGSLRERLEGNTCADRRNDVPPIPRAVSRH